MTTLEVVFGGANEPGRHAILICLARIARVHAVENEAAVAHAVCRLLAVGARAAGVQRAVAVGATTSVDARGVVLPERSRRNARGHGRHCRCALAVGVDRTIVVVAGVPGGHGATAPEVRRPIGDAAPVLATPRPRSVGLRCPQTRADGALWHTTELDECEVREVSMAALLCRDDCAAET